jgi:peptidoglycan-associated lipoprotein
MVLMSSLIFMDTGCKSANGGWRWPWQKDRALGLGADDSIGPELVMDSGLTDFDSVYGEGGDLISGSRFEDAYAPVQGIAFEPVYFTYDSYVLPPNEIAKVDLVGQHLNSNAGHVLVIEGHCDERGSNEYNLSLGENRALALRSYLVNMGISADRIQTRSFGEEKPAVIGMDESAWSMNRRGEFAFFQR